LWRLKTTERFQVLLVVAQETDGAVSPAPGCGAGNRRSGFLHTYHFLPPKQKTCSQRESRSFALRKKMVEVPGDERAFSQPSSTNQFIDAKTPISGLWLSSVIMVVFGCLVN
jgi:hypothetical protein